MDHDDVRLSLVLGPVENAIHTYSYVMPRWKARNWCALFAFGELWEGQRVLRALIVP
jgi:hypothetical protein